MENLKRIWYSPITLITTIVQVILPICRGTIIFTISLGISVAINIAATILINYSIKWYENKNMVKEAEGYRKSAPAIFQTLKFAMGIIVSSIIAIISLFYKIEGLNAEKLLITWFFVPLLLVFITIAMLDVGLFDNISLSKKVGKIRLFFKKFIFCMFDSDENGKIIYSVKSIVSTILLFVMIIVVIAYYIFIFYSR